MPMINRRVPFSPQNPFRKSRPATSKIIFLSFEGSVTEEEYFNRISELYSEIGSKIQFISVAEDAVHTIPKFRTADQVRMLTKARPKQLVERIDHFKQEKDDIYQFSKYPDDEFWIVTDVDKNWSIDVISLNDGKTYLDEWNDAIALCQQKGYGYAISNPFFEIWLLLHHDEPTDIDKSFAVTDTHPYVTTDYFRIRLKNLGAKLKDKKHITFLDYNTDNVEQAIKRAASLHIDKQDLTPKYFATTVYLLMEKIMDMLPKSEPIE